MKEKRNHNIFKKLIDLLLLIFSVCLFLATCGIFYVRVYLKTFFVDGQSMWPTLNANAVDAAGNVVGQTGGNSKVGYRVECGVYDPHKSAINKIKRFDIIATHYPNRGEDEFIKRVIGLPGETVKIVNVTGELYINGEFVEQPIDTEILKDYTSATEVTLKDDEYYVCGDNRRHSSDSRNSSVGPIKKELICGRVIAVYGTAVIELDKNGDNTIKPLKIKPQKVRILI